MYIHTRLHVYAYSILKALRGYPLRLGGAKTGVAFGVLFCPDLGFAYSFRLNMCVFVCLCVCVFVCVCVCSFFLF